jgi:hypothetical protein
MNSFESDALSVKSIYHTYRYWNSQRENVIIIFMYYCAHSSVLRTGMYSHYKPLQSLDNY